MVALYRKVCEREKGKALSLKNYSSNYGAEDKVILSK